MNIEQTYIVPSQPTFTIGTGLLGIVAEALVKAEEEREIENQLNKVEALNKEIKDLEKQIAQTKEVIAETKDTSESQKSTTEAKNKSIPTPVAGQHIDLTVDDINVKPVSPEAIKLTAIAKAMKEAQK